MSERTVNWAAARARGESPAEGLRERKKRLMRQQLSDTATTMFMERGFDAVRVAEVAEACGVSEKTVFNYFPTKESLLLDRWDTTLEALRAGLADADRSPVEAIVQILDDELRAQTGWLSSQDDPAQAVASMLRFGELIRATPALRAQQGDMTSQLIAVAAELLAERAGQPADDPEPQVTAIALLGLWQVQADSLTRNLRRTADPDQLRAAVAADVQRAADRLSGGLG
jgi:AcrR family transcriptional regulator